MQTLDSIVKNLQENLNLPMQQTTDLGSRLNQVAEMIDSLLTLKSVVEDENTFFRNQIKHLRSELHRYNDSTTLTQEQKWSEVLRDKENQQMNSPSFSGIGSRRMKFGLEMSEIRPPKQIDYDCVDNPSPFIDFNL